MDQNDVLLVGYNKTEGGKAILIIGRKEVGETVELINQFEGEEAEHLYSRLITVKEKNENE